jgi:hypothetical protein
VGFLRRQVTAVAGGRRGGPRHAGSGQLGAGAFGEAVCADVVQQLVGQQQGDASVPRPPGAPEPFAVQEVAAGEVGGSGCAAVLVDGLAVQVVGIQAVACGEARTRARNPSMTGLELAAASLPSWRAMLPVVSWRPERCAASARSGSANLSCEVSAMPEGKLA